MKTDITLLFQAESKTVYRLVSSEGTQYPFATPRKRKEPDIPVITLRENMRPGKGKPDFFIKNGIGENLAGIYFDAERRFGYGNRERRDTLLAEWNREIGTLTVYVILKVSENATKDRELFHEWQAKL